MKEIINNKIYDTSTATQVAEYFFNGWTNLSGSVKFFQKRKSGELFYTIGDEIYTNRPMYNHYAVGVLAKLMAENPVSINKIENEYEHTPFVVINNEYVRKYNTDEINAISDTLSKYDDLTQDKVLQVLLY